MRDEPKKKEIEMTKANDFLKLISSGETLILDAVDGTETLYGASDVFAYRDSNFKNYGVNEKELATGKIPVDMHEMIKDATFAQVFGSLSSDVKKLCLTQHQIKNFVKKYRNWLRDDGYATFFLFESNNELFVAHVYFDSDGGLKVLVRRFEYSLVWRVGLCHRLVVPQLAAA